MQELRIDPIFVHLMDYYCKVVRNNFCQSLVYLGGWIL